MNGDVLFAAGETSFQVQALSGHERVGEPSDFQLEVLSAEAVDPAPMIGLPGRITLVGAFGSRNIHGVIVRFTAIATSNAAAARRYKVRLCSEIFRLNLRKTRRVFQNLAAIDIAKKILPEAGVAADRIAVHLTETHPPRKYVVQYDESDFTFIRRLCEEEGIYFHHQAKDGFDQIEFDDTSSQAPEAEDAKVTLSDAGQTNHTAPAAFSCSSVRKRRPGKVTLRDYNPEKPAVKLEGVAEAGTDEEKAREIYRAPGRFSTPDEGKTRAQVLLQSLRAEAQVFDFETTSMALAPGLSFEMEVGPNYSGTARPEGKFFVVEVNHNYRRQPPTHTHRVKTVPLSTPFRLPMSTPRPYAPGLQNAMITGAPGEEIHTDAGGHVKVRFPWDREQAGDDKSSLPIRVVQPNTPGSMLIPRVGWEVLVAFEDGDPDRPYILGRLYNGKHPPPFALPANKTMTALSTVASPGGARPNAVHIDDAAGRQHMVWNAGFNKTTTVANNMVTQTIGFEATKVTGNQTWSVGANETVSIKSTAVTKVGSQSASVGANQSLMLKAAGRTTTGSENVLVGGALLEQVGNPVAGAAGFAEAAALSAAGSIPVVGNALTKAYSIGKGVVEGYKSGGLSGALMAGGQQVAGAIAGEIVGGDAVLAGLDAAGITPWSDKAQQAAGAAAAGGGTGGPGGAAAGAAQAAPGHRKTIVDGIMAESIGAAHTVTTPGSIKWTSLGAANFAIGGGHSTKAVRISRLTGGISSDTAASISITTAQGIGRNIKGALKTSIGGSLKVKAGGPYVLKAGGALTFKVGGSMNVEGGAVVFAVGSGTVVAIHSGGVLFKASKVTINGKAVQSGKATNSE